MWLLNISNLCNICISKKDISYKREPTTNNNIKTEERYVMDITYLLIRIIGIIKKIFKKKFYIGWDNGFEFSNIEKYNNYYAVYVPEYSARKQ